MRTQIGFEYSSLKSGAKRDFSMSYSLFMPFNPIGFNILLYILAKLGNLVFIYGVTFKYERLNEGKA